MATSIGVLSIMIKANTKAFEKGIDRSKKKTQGFKASMAGVAKSMAGATIAFAAAAVAVRRVASAIAETMTTMDELAKKSRSLGITGQQLNEMRIASARAGIEAAGLSTALQRMMKTASEGRVGLSTAVRAFDQLGISAQELKGLDPQELLLEIANGMKGVTDQQEKARIAMDIFGRSGLPMLNLLQGGAAELADSFERARMLGIIDEDGLRRVEAANDAMGNLKDQLAIMRMNLVSELAPAIKSIAEDIGELTTAMKDAGIIKAISAWVFVTKEFHLSLFRALQAVEMLRRVVNLEISFGEGIQEFNDNVFGTSGSVVQSSETFRENIEAAANEIKTINLDPTGKLSALGQSQADRAAQIREGLLTPQQRFDRERRELGMLNDFGLITLKEFYAARNKLEEDFFGKGAEAAQAAAAVFAATRTEEEKFTASLMDLQKLFEVGAITGDTFKRAVKAEFNKFATETAQTGGDITNPQALQRGSLAAASKSLELRQRAANSGVEEKVEQNTEVLGKKLDDILDSVNTPDLILDF